MKTRVLAIYEKSLSTAAKIIQNGGVVAFPTETVYGLGANAFDSQAVSKIFVAKGRPQDNPLIVHVCDTQMISSIAEVSAEAQALIDAFMPSPLTLVLPKKSCIAPSVTAGLSTVGVRMPSSTQARAFIKACGVPIAAPSANTSMRPSPTNWSAVYEDMSGRIPLILKGEDCEVGIESTVVDMCGKARILRPGIITPAMLSEVLGYEVSYACDSTDKPSSPGVKYPHYQPNVPTVLFTSFNAFAVREEYNDKLSLKPVVLCSSSTATTLQGISVYSYGDDAIQASHNYYAALRKLEKEYGYIIQVYCFDDQTGTSLLNRMRKSANGNIREV